MSRVSNFGTILILHNYGRFSVPAAVNVSLLSTAARWFCETRGADGRYVKVGPAWHTYNAVSSKLAYLRPTVGECLCSTGHFSVVELYPFASLLKTRPWNQIALSHTVCPRTNGDVLKVEWQPVIQLSLRNAMITRQFWALCAYTYRHVLLTNRYDSYCAYAVDYGISTASAATITVNLGQCVYCG